MGPASRSFAGMRTRPTGPMVEHPRCVAVSVGQQRPIRATLGAAIRQVDARGDLIPNHKPRTGIGLPCDWVVGRQQWCAVVVGQAVLVSGCGLLSAARIEIKPTITMIKNCLRCIRTSFCYQNKQCSIQRTPASAGLASNQRMVRRSLPSCPGAHDLKLLRRCSGTPYGAKSPSGVFEGYAARRY